MKDKKTKQENANPQTQETWKVFRNEGPYGEYYSLKKGDLKIFIPARLFQIADGYFNKKKNSKKESDT